MSLCGNIFHEKMNNIYGCIYEDRWKWMYQFISYNRINREFSENLKQPPLL